MALRRRYNVVTSEDKSQAVAVEGAALLGGLIGGELGAEGGALLGSAVAGPPGAVVGAMVGALVGGATGGVIGAVNGKAIHDGLSNPQNEKR